MIPILVISVSVYVHVLAWFCRRAGWMFLEFEKCYDCYLTFVEDKMRDMLYHI